jgi:hypothetical protein
VPSPAIVLINPELNVAVTVCAEVIETEQDPRPEQAPDQFAKSYPWSEAYRLTVPVNVAEQVPGHEIPEGELVTLPFPLTLTVSVCGGLNVAVTLFAPLIVTEQVCAVPEQAPDQPLKTYPLDGEEVRRTVVPYENAAEHVPGQEMPAGELVTVPLPLTVTESVSGIAVNVALTLVGLYSVTWQAPVPEHEPDQPEKLYPVEGEAVRLTAVP